MKKDFDLDLLSKYRTALMGFAAICILVCHAPANGIVLPHYLFILMGYGNIGVDIFLLLSGIGCWFSLHRRPNLKIWYKKRFVKILVPYILIQVPFWFYLWFYGDFNLLYNLYVLSTVAFWIDHVGAWYIALILPLYCLTPLLHYLFDKYRVITLVTLPLFIIILFNVDWEFSFQGTPVWHNIQWACRRIISFIIGLYIAPWVMNKKHICSCICIIFFIALWCFARIFFTSKYSLWLLEFPIIIIVVKLLDFCENGLLNRLFVWFGVLSLESYLANIYLCSILFSNQTILKLIDTYIHIDILIYMIIILVGTFIAYLTCKLSNILCKLIKY